MTRNLVILQDSRKVVDTPLHTPGWDFGIDGFRYALPILQINKDLKDG